MINMAYNETLKTQYQIMTAEHKTENGYIPNIPELIAEAPCPEMAEAWQSVADLIEKCKNTNHPFAFTFRTVYTHQKRDGTYTIYQHGMPTDWTISECEADLFEWIEKVELPQMGGH